MTNNSNIAITEGAISEAGLTDFSGAIYWDANGNGVIVPSDAGSEGDL
ncbi:hypothetical protein [Sulfitobacter sp. HI0129]|nr:hypothetical protein [Sulfitobacter sp. HI0129]